MSCLADTVGFFLDSATRNGSKLFHDVEEVAYNGKWDLGTGREASKFGTISTERWVTDGGGMFDPDTVFAEGKICRAHEMVNNKKS